MAISDTSPEIAAMQLEIRRKMSASQRLKIAFELSELTRDLRMAGIRRQHPDWSERQIMMEHFRLCFFPGPLPTWVRCLKARFSAN